MEENENHRTCEQEARGERGWSAENGRGCGEGRGRGRERDEDEDKEEDEEDEERAAMRGQQSTSLQFTYDCSWSSAAASISSCKIFRFTPSSAAGFESSSTRTCAHA